MIGLLAAIEFLTPLFLTAGLAAVIPLIIHMLQRQRAPERRFSTLRFLKLSCEKTARKRHLRDLWLLLFRMAVLVLLALGLSRPLLRGAQALFGDRSVAVAIVLDNSPSMALADGGSVRFERARQRALTIVDQLRPGDQVALLLTGGPTLQSETTYERVENVQRLLETARISLAHANLPAALTRARQILESSETPNRELYVLTDLQRSEWTGLANEETQTPDSSDKSAEASFGDAAAEDIPTRVVVVDVHQERPANLLLEQVEAHAAVPAVGVPLRIAASVHNGGRSSEATQVELTLNGQPVDLSPTFSLEAGESREIEFRYVPLQEGLLRGRVRLVGEDASGLDNERAFVVDMQGAVQVALIDHREQDEPAHRSAGYYLERALRPVTGNSYAIEVSHLEPALVAQEPLGSYSALVCVDLEADDELFAALRTYAEAGGTLIWICGPRNDPSALSASVDAASFLPGEFSYPDALQPNGANWGFLDADAPWLAPLTKPASVYQSVNVERYFQLSLSAESGARVLARLDNGDPVLVSQHVGRGTVYVLTSGAHPQWTSLPLRPIFVPLMNRLILRSTTREFAAAQVRPGNPALFQFADEPEPVTVELRQPGRDTPLQLQSTEVDGAQRLRFTETHDGGIYEVRMTRARHPQEFAFAVNFDPEEADTRTLTAEELGTRLGSAVEFATDEASLDEAILRLREGTPLMDWFLVLVLIIGVLEVLVANRLGNREPIPAETRRADIRDVLRRAATFHQLETYHRR